MNLSIFLDLKKAFDTVDHKTLLLKLRKYGITSTSYSWFTSYLTNREQFCHCYFEVCYSTGFVFGSLAFLIVC